MYKWTVYTPSFLHSLNTNPDPSALHGLRSASLSHIRVVECSLFWGSSRLHQSYDYPIFILR